MEYKSFKRFLILWIGEFISAIGSGLTAFGIGVYVYQITGKASLMALITLLAFAPALLLSTFSGVLADRYDRRLMMILGDSLSVLGLIYILICFLIYGRVEIWQICIGVVISSIFSSLTDPAYKATISDLLSEDEFTKASGLVQIAGASKYLISPVIAGFLLSRYDLSFILILDISTFFITVFTTFFIRKGIPVKKTDVKESFLGAFIEGWNVIADNTGILMLVILGSALTFFLGFIQILSLPMILSFAGSSMAGMVETIVASGMLLSSLLIGIIPIRKGYTKILSVSLLFEGIFMMLFGLRENILLISVSGFLFFAMMPFANASLDYLIRTNVNGEFQGRVWSLISVISQLGYIAAYAVSGILTDYIITPILQGNTIFAIYIGRIIGTGRGRGAGLLIIFAGFFLGVTAILFGRLKPIRDLEQTERRGELCI